MTARDRETTTKPPRWRKAQDGRMIPDLPIPDAEAEALADAMFADVLDTVKAFAGRPTDGAR